MQVNIQKVVDQLAQKIGQLETEKAIALAQIDALDARIKELEAADIATTAGEVAAKK